MRAEMVIERKRMAEAGNSAAKEEDAAPSQWKNRVVEMDERDQPGVEKIVQWKRVNDRAEQRMGLEVYL